MSEKFNGKYRIPSARAPWWDYRNNGAYFITICTKNRRHFFGNVVDGEMYLSDMGNIAHNFWAEIPAHFPFVHLGAFIVMPNHMHGILVIQNDLVETLDSNVSTDIADPPKNKLMSSISPKTGSVSAIIRSYKSEVTKYCRKYFDPNFGWQTRFHDRIIRDEEAFRRISRYIQQNPGNWGKGGFLNKGK